MDKAARLSSGVKSIRSSSESPCRSNGFGLVGIGCVRELFSPGMLLWGTRVSLIGQIGSPVFRLNT